MCACVGCVNWGWGGWGVALICYISFDARKCILDGALDIQRNVPWCFTMSYPPKKYMKESTKCFDPSPMFYSSLPGVMIGKFLSKWEVIHKKCIFENEKANKENEMEK